MATYLAITTENADMLGYHIVAMGESRDATEQTALRIIGNPNADIHAQTNYRNLTTLSKTQAIKRFGRSWYDYQIEYHQSELDYFNEDMGTA